MEISIDCQNASAPPPRSHQTRLILLIPVIVAAIPAIFARVFELESRDFDIVGCIFNGNIEDHGLQYDISFGM